MIDVTFLTNKDKEELERKISQGGGGGGVSSWNDLTDKPFYEEHSVVEILPECQPAYDDADTPMFVLTDTIDFVVGTTCIVNWNGVEYSCVVQDASAMMGGLSFYVVGNASGMGLVGNDEPFTIAYGPDAMIAMGGGSDWTGAISPHDGTTELTISIKGEQTVIVPLSTKYLPFSIYTVVVDFDAGTNTTVADKTFAEVAEKVKDPTVQVRVFARGSYNGMLLEYSSLNFTQYDVADGEILFTAPCNEFCFWSATMKSDGSIDFGTVSYKGLDS